MICEECRVDSYIIYIDRDHKKLCDKCFHKDNDPDSYEKIFVLSEREDSYV